MSASAFTVLSHPDWGAPGGGPPSFHEAGWIRVGTDVDSYGRPAASGRVTWPLVAIYHTCRRLRLQICRPSAAALALACLPWLRNLAVPLVSVLCLSSRVLALICFALASCERLGRRSADASLLCSILLCRPCIAACFGARGPDPECGPPAQRGVDCLWTDRIFAAVHPFVSSRRAALLLFCDHVPWIGALGYLSGSG